MLRLQNLSLGLDLEKVLIFAERSAGGFRNVTVVLVLIIIIGYLHLNMVSCTCTHSTFKDRYLSNDSRVVTKRKESPPTFNIAFKVTLRA